MNIVTLSVVAVLVGWLATLILHSDVDRLSLLDLGVGVAGAALVGGLLAPFFGISMTGEYGFTLSGTFVSWLGAMSLLALVNLARHGQILCGRRQPQGNRQSILRRWRVSSKKPEVVIDNPGRAGGGVLADR
jgi:uncharacterized membrane protein YeaQ/YmgE (transglycosylase-associated protein family)